MNSDRLAITIRRVDDQGYRLEMSDDCWLAAVNCLNEFVNGVRVVDHELMVGASRNNLRLALDSLNGWSMADSGLRASVMVSAEERALEAALNALVIGDWMTPTEFHPRIGVFREDVLELTSRLRALRVLADENFGA